MREGTVLISMPFSSLNYPSMALSLLKPSLLKAGMACEVRYFLLDFADRIGHEAQETLTDSRYYKALVGEWLFASLVSGGRAEDDLSYLTDCFARDFPEHHTAARMMAILSARQEAAPFLDECLAEIEASSPAIVGFTTSFQQNMASLALAQRIKQICPEILVVFGGANCRGEMGIALHRQYPFIDAVCLDEGERAFPALVRGYLDGLEPADIPAVIWRRHGASVLPSRMNDPAPVMDDLPYPDFSDFFAQHAATQVAHAHYPPAALFETSRGCWWGAKHHCTFCGINGSSMAYRSKSQDRAYEELSFLAGRYGSDFVNVDSILDPKYFKGFIPRLAEAGPAVTIYYELKANLKPEQLRLLAAAGIHKIQPGIESLDSDILSSMRKGCTMLQNVQTLKLAAENGIYVEWNLLYGFPGETSRQYQGMARLLPKLRHLQPPGVLGRVRADRFSPLFSAPSDFGVTIRPAPAYAYLYPFEDAAVRELAYHFEVLSDELREAEGYVAPVVTECEVWREHAEASAFSWRDQNECVTVTDERWGWPRTAPRVLGDVEAEICRLCWTIASRAQLRASLSPRFGEVAVDDALERLEALGILLRAGEECLLLPLREPGYRSAPTWSEVRRANAAARAADPLPA